jgi:hypothetical protein
VAVPVVAFPDTDEIAMGASWRKKSDGGEFPAEAFLP